jgi:hypothetical protein
MLLQQQQQPGSTKFLQPVINDLSRTGSNSHGNTSQTHHTHKTNLARMPFKGSMKNQTSARSCKMVSIFSNKMKSVMKLKMEDPVSRLKKCSEEIPQITLKCTAKASNSSQ